MPGTSRHFQVTPTGCDLWVENHADQDIASVNFISNIDNVTLSNITASGGTMAGALQFDNADPVTIRLTFSAPLTNGAIAKIYNGGSNNLVGIINIAAGDTRGTIRIYPPIASDAFFVRVYN
jgi:hypothetical protein